MIILLLIHFLNLLTVQQNIISSPLRAPHWGTVSDLQEESACERTAGQVRVLLLLSGDVERNPGPGQESVDLLINGLADLVGQAPGGLRDVLCVWAPDKPTNEIAAELNSKKFTVTVLQPALAWLLNREVSDPIVKAVKKKADIVDAVILGIERLLPDMCGVCNESYVVKREALPQLECKGCGQGFHEPCLEKLTGCKSLLPQIPGSLHWLCPSCTPHFDLVTRVGQGGRCKPPRKSTLLTGGTGGLVAVAGGDPTPSPPADSSGGLAGAPPACTPPPPAPPAAKVRCGLPYLWPELSEVVVSVSERGSSNISHSKTSIATPRVQCALPFLWQPNSPPDQPEIREDCEHFLKGECRHGISGKTNGGCSKAHRKICGKFLKWGDRNAMGCSDASCCKVHPLVCTKSLDLKCFDKTCSFKLHTKRCKRSPPSPKSVKNRVFTPQPRSNRPPVWEGGHGHGLGGVAHPPRTSAQSKPGQGTGQGSGPHVQAPAHLAQPNFQMRCTPPSPAVHQLIETWVGNMQQELERQTVMTRNMMDSKMKDLFMYLGSQAASTHLY